MRTAVVLVALGALGCGRIGFDARGDGGAGGDDGAPSDGPTTPFGAATSIAIGSGAACAVREDHTLWCWGDLRFGTLPAGTFSATVRDRGFAHPNQVGTDADWAEVALGDYHGCARKLDDTLWCWGDNAGGAVGTTTTGVIDLPTNVAGAWRHVAAGGRTTCAISAADRLWCWGNNADGQFGTGTTTSSNQPVENPTLSGLTHIAVSDTDVCALASTKLYCWGHNSDGEIGDNTTMPSHVPLQVPGAWKQVSLGFYATSAIATDGTLWHWGHGLSLTRAQMGTRTDWVETSTPMYGTCAIDTSGALWCLSRNFKGDSGLGSLVPTVLTNVEPGHTFSRITNVGTLFDVLGQEAVGCVNRDGELACTGSGWRGQIGDGDSSRWSRAPRRVGGTWKALYARPRTTCGRDAASQISCWGDDPLGADASTSEPRLVSTETFSSISSDDLSCGVHTSGAVWTWGLVPTDNVGAAYQGLAILDAAPATAVSCAAEHGAIIRNNGTLWAWGRNDVNQVGDGTTTFRALPVQIGAGMMSVSVGRLHGCAITTGLNIACWGDNSQGQLGDGTVVPRATPTTIAMAGPWSQVSTGPYYTEHTCAIRADNASLWCWGNNTFGELGRGTSGGSNNTPMRVGTDTWKQVSAGWAVTCAVRSDGTLWCWGDNRGGHRDGTYGPGGSEGPDVDAPKQLGTDTDWMSVASAITHTCARKMNDEVWCWGSNDAGQLGTSTTVDTFHRVVRE